ncbi:DUF4175 domain-containing protein [Phytoactinopolyspora halotolerans]|uniref:DUF4175 domain-containing protein n=1 Tax=Phytoactinopolyspora halotolerans TaxID=1981512 RepID=A0A6L9S9N6_9ACTN|nr:DUF4175 domain-containing protein [Phytoactinopolyspora halotolerans]NEE01411.1 DUF4175 domain-containing protein [Phytoactinopolyspora halotolerans]
MTTESSSGTDGRGVQEPARPTVITVGVPYLALLWCALLACLIGFSFTGSTDLASNIWPMALWTVIWNTVLYRVWRGGPMAIRAVALLTTVIPGMTMVVVVAMAILTRNSLGGQLFDDMPTWWWLLLAAYAGAFVIGIGLRRADVREWSAALHPPRTRAEAALRRSGGLRIGPPSPTAPFTPASGTDDANDRAADEADGRPAAAHHADARTSVADSAGPPREASFSVDLGEKLRGQAKFRIGCFGVFIAFFGIIAVVIGVETLRGDEDWVPAASFAALVLLLVAALVISVRRFGGRLGARSTLTIDRTGVTWQGGQDLASFSWNGLAGVGISYYMATTKNGKKMHMPQLDIYEQVSSPAGRWPELDRRRRQERPPEPQLPGELYRLMLPVDDQIHRMIEETVCAHRPALWLGWYERPRSDTPWFLR